MTIATQVEMRRTILIAAAARAICGFRDAAAAESKTVVTVYMLQESVASTLFVMSARAQATRRPVRRLDTLWQPAHTAFADNEGCYQ